LLVAAAAAASLVQAADPQPPKVNDTLAQRLAACAACHGEQGEGLPRSEYYPRIAGKPAQYLYLQLVNFREGRRTYPQMVYMTRYMSDEYLMEIANYYSKLKPPFPTPIQPSTTRDALARGERLVRQGDPARGLPACAACHGNALTGMQPGIPGLIGLYPDYIAAQIGAWQRGVRHGTDPDCMSKVTGKLTGSEIGAIAAYLAFQPGTPTTIPDPEGSRKIPVACGSQFAIKPSSDAGVSGASTGEYLARIGDCVACHTARGGEPFAGGLAMATPFGTLYTPNITSDPETGIGKWSPDDFWRALHDGKSRNGSLLYPAFPYPSYTKVTRADSDAIYDYLTKRAPISRRNTPHQMQFPYNQRNLLIGWRALYFEPGVYQPNPKESAEWNRGAYLVQGLGHCDACHTSRNFAGATVKDKQLGGGLIPLQEWYAPSLTSNREAGLGQWETSDVVDLLRTGVSRRGIVFGPMAQVVHDSLQYVSDADTRAMAVYLKSLAQTGGAEELPQIRPTEGQSKASFEAGAKLYENHCQSCHGANGVGAPPAYPPLANNQAISMEFASNPIRMVLFGGYPPSTRANPRPYGMPPFAYFMNDQEVADVVTYMRQSWGNRGTAINPADVARYRTVPVD
jgi:mono/diheme cytochrome c family protein